MARYILLDEKKIARLKSEAQRFQDDIVCAVGTDFMQNIAEAENKMIFDILNGLESEPTADVAPKSEVAMEIIREIAKHAGLPDGCEYTVDERIVYLTAMNNILGVLAKLQNKYMEGRT